MNRPKEPETEHLLFCVTCFKGPEEDRELHACLKCGVALCQWCEEHWCEAEASAEPEEDEP